jgi:hypothetical protein
MTRYLHDKIFFSTARSIVLEVGDHQLQNQLPCKKGKRKEKKKKGFIIKHRNG